MKASRRLKKYERIMRTFMTGVERHQGEGIPQGMPDCMYWLKHHEAALVVAALTYGFRHRIDLPPILRDLYGEVSLRMAQQWNDYEKLAEKLAGTGNPKSPEASSPQKEQD